MILSKMAMTDLYSHRETNEEIMGEKKEYGKNWRIVLHRNFHCVFIKRKETLWFQL